MAVSDSAADVNLGVIDAPCKLRMLAVLAVAIFLAAVPSFVTRAMYTAEGFSSNAFVTALVLPVLYLLILAAVMILVARIHLAGGFDIVWWRGGRSEGRWAILLVVVVLLAHCVGGWLLRRLNLPLVPDRIFWADQWGLSRFVALTICAAILTPIVEELFWRGYVQDTLNRVFGGSAGLLGQAVLSAALHLQAFGGFLNMFVFALIVGLDG